MTRGMHFAIGAVLITVLIATLHSSEPTARNCKTRDNYIRCTDAYFKNYAEKYGTVHALQKLSTEMNADGELATLCHSTMHEIGHVAVTEFGGLGGAFKVGNNLCQNGYYHGVVEKFFEHETLTSLSNTRKEALCEEHVLGTSSTALRQNCVHGIGHALMYITGGDISSSLFSCSTYAKDEDKAQCVTGALMEEGFAVQRSTSTDKTKNDPTLICSQALGDQNGCWLSEGSKVILQKGGGRNAALNFCHQIISSDFRKTCELGIASE